MERHLIGWFQKISITIPWVASQSSEGEGGSIDWNSKGMGGGFIGLEFHIQAESFMCEFPGEGIRVHKSSPNWDCMLNYAEER